MNLLWRQVGAFESLGGKDGEVGLKDLEDVRLLPYIHDES